MKRFLIVTMFFLLVALGGSASGGPQSPDFLDNAHLAHREGRHADEVYWYERAWPSLSQNLAHLPITRARFRINYALALWNSGNSEEAVTQSETAWTEIASVESLEDGRFLPSNAEDLVAAAFVMGNARANLGDTRGAEQSYQRGIHAAREHNLGYSVVLVALTHAELAKLQARSGRITEARATIEPVAASTSAARCTPVWSSLLQLLADVQEDLKDEEGRAATMSRLAEDIVYGGCPRSE